MKTFLLLLVLANLHLYAKEHREELQEKQQERDYAPDPEKNERTYSAPIERPDERRQEMEIDEERDLDEKRAEQDGATSL